MKGVRLLAVAAVLSVAAWSAWAFVWRPLQCHRLKGRLSAISYQAYERRHEESARQTARRNIEQLERCLAPACRNVRLFFLLAINHRTLGRPEAALDLYRRSLRYERRPEIYANIADTQLSMGNEEEGYRNFLTAVLFFPGYLRNIDDPALRARVRAELLRRHPEQRGIVERIESPEGERFLRLR